MENKMKKLLPIILILYSTHTYAFCLTPSTFCQFNEDSTQCQLRINSEYNAYQNCLIRKELNQLRNEQRSYIR